VGYAETGKVDAVELHDSPVHCEDYGASDGLSCCDRNGLIVQLAQAGRHIDAEHVNGSLSVSPIVSSSSGDQ
jgi:hypothetical protein